VASDHGNLEDASVKTHTLNPAFFAAWGSGRKQSGASVRALTDLAPLAMRLLGATSAGLMTCQP